MNFIKGIFSKIGGGGTSQPAIDQEIFDFVILGTIYKQEEDKFSKLYLAYFNLDPPIQRFCLTNCLMMNLIIFS